MTNSVPLWQAQQYGTQHEQWLFSGAVSSTALHQRIGRTRQLSGMMAAVLSEGFLHEWSITTPGQ